MLRALFLLSLACLSGFASDDAKVLLEKIQFEGRHKIQEQSLLAELRLEANAHYRLTQIEQAIAHLRALPFVLEVSYQLQPGSSADTRVLQIVLVEQHSLNLDAEYYRSQYSSSDHSDGDSWKLGYHKYLGQSGLLMVSTVNNASYDLNDNLSLEYRDASLFGSKFQLDLGLEWEDEETAFFGIQLKDALTPSLTLSYLLGQNQRLGITYSKYSRETKNAGTEDDFSLSSNSERAGLFWSYDTRDDVRFALQGSRLQLSWSQEDGNRHYSEPLGSFSRTEIDSDGFAVQADYVCPWKQRGAWFTAFQFLDSNQSATSSNEIVPVAGRFDYSFTSGDLSMGFRQKLPTFAWIPFKSEIRWDLMAFYSKARYSLDSETGSESQNSDTHGVEASLRLRNIWGSAILSLSYTN